jgi:Na+:H+ antiporter, NhaA family
VIPRRQRAKPASSDDQSALQAFLETESAGGILLVIFAAIAMIWANSPWSSSYERAWTASVPVSLHSHTVRFVVRQFVNEGLVAVFFLVAGLEIKRELVGGRLAARRAALLPIAAAVGGMLVPALIYLSIAGRTAPRGWAIVVATDIALAVGVVSIAGRRVSPEMRVFLLALAIVDDVGALLIIAAFYSAGIGWGWLGLSIVVLGATWLGNRSGLAQLWFYVVAGCLLWLTLHRAGISPTLSGVAVGLMVPVPVIERFEKRLHPLATYAIVPLFALANSGVTLSTQLLHAAIRSPITWAIIAGRVIGKPLGIVLTTKSMIRTGLADHPGGASGRQLLGVATSAGMGFTVALFITELALPEPGQRAVATLAILMAAVLAAGLSLSILLARDLSSRHSSPERAGDEA